MWTISIYLNHEYSDYRYSNTKLPSFNTVVFKNVQQLIFLGDTTFYKCTKDTYQIILIMSTNPEP
jgi:hypothetical protein